MYVVVRMPLTFEENNRKTINTDLLLRSLLPLVLRLYWMSLATRSLACSKSVSFRFLSVLCLV